MKDDGLCIEIQVSMFNMDWVFVNGRSLCSIKDAKAALGPKPWMVDRWLTQDRFKDVSKEDFIQSLRKVVERYQEKEETKR